MTMTMRTAAKQEALLEEIRHDGSMWLGTSSPRWPIAIVLKERGLIHVTDGNSEGALFEPVTR